MSNLFAEATRYCLECSSTDCSAANPIVPVMDEDEETNEWVHVDCVERSESYGFCWCCAQSRAHLASALNNAAECLIHEGESRSEYPEDLESYIENVRNNE